MNKILLIEDDKSLRVDVAEMLEFEGFSVETAENGLVGLQKLHESKPDLILCDVMMPELDGFEVLTQIKENKATEFIPFVFLTALAERENTRNGMNLGADDYIVKPFTREELLNSVNTCLSKSKKIKEKEKSVLSDLKLKLIKNLPHELRTPLNAIIGFGQILAESASNFSTDEITSFGKNIYESGLKLNRLVQNYLLFAELELRNSPINSNEVMEVNGNNCRLLAELIADKYDRRSDLKILNASGIACIGQDEFKKVVEELLDNAFKFSGPGSLVEISCNSDDKHFYLSIVDKGRGMIPEEIENLGAFNQFNREYYEQQGSGLGLIIAKKIVEIYDGNFEIKSKTGEGTSIFVQLPVPHN
jgi:signal transduction histidine kinase